MTDKISVAKLKSDYPSDKKLEEIGVEVITYVGIATKSVIISTIVDSCVSTNSQLMLEVDLIAKEIHADIAFINNWTNVELDADKTVEDYDWVIESGLMERLRDAVGGDYWLTCDLLEKTIEQKIALNNSIESALTRGINAIVSKIPDSDKMSELMASFSAEFKNFDMSKLESVGQTLNLISGGADKPVKKKKK